MLNALDALAKKTENRMPQTLLYNEGWMLRLVLNWFANNSDKISDHPLSFCPESDWYSEALLPSQFLPRHRGDILAESHTHADGVIGHHDEIGSTGNKGELSLKERESNQFIVTEAKMFSKLSSGTKRAKLYNQAARNVACMAEVICRADKKPIDFQKLGFYVIAPEKQLHEENTFSIYTGKKHIKETVEARVELYNNDTPDYKVKKHWLETHFYPLLEGIDIRCISWESLVKSIGNEEYEEFYLKCLECNQPKEQNRPA